MALMKAQPSVPVVQQIVTLKSTGVAGLTIGLMILIGCAEVPSEQLEQVWKRFSAKGPVNGSRKLYTITIINTIWNLGSPELYVVVNNFHVVGKLPVVGLVYAKQFMSSTYTGPSFRKLFS